MRDLPRRSPRARGRCAGGTAEGDLRPVPRRNGRVQAHRHDLHAVPPGSPAVIDGDGSDRAIEAPRDARAPEPPGDGTEAPPAMSRFHRAYVIAMCAII